MVTCWGRSSGTLTKTSLLISDLSSVKHSLRLTVTLGSIVWVVLAWRIWEKDMVYLCPTACKKLNLGAKNLFCVHYKEVLSVHFLQEALCTFRKQLSFMKEKSHNEHYSDHLCKIFLSIDLPAFCTTWELPWSKFLLLLNLCSACPSKMLLVSCVFQSVLFATLILEFRRAFHFLTTLSLRVCCFL